MSKEELVLLHLSDIHFRHGVSGETFDLDQDLRNELELDAQRLSQEVLGVDGIIISGDIAFAGRAEEYDLAFEWLQKLCGLVSCLPENVWMVPGNHDVDRTVISGSKILQDLHRTLRPADPSHINELLKAYLQDDQEASEIIFRPLARYNAFASRFRCSINGRLPYWEDDLKLNDGSILRLRGITSALVSDQSDDDAANKLLVGSAPATVMNQDGVEHLVVCHHPPTWLRDQDAVTDIWNNRTRLQLFGHKHRQRILQIGNSVALASGATHPSRREPNWRPTFNFISLSIMSDAGVRYLRVQIRPRVWSDDELRFIGDHDSTGADVRAYQLPLREWQNPTSASESAPAEEVKAVLTAHDDPVATLRIDDRPIKASNMNVARRLTYRYLSLPYPVRIKIAQELALLHEDDKGISDVELLGRFFRRAEETRQMGSLWAKVEAAYGDAQAGESNPFAGR